jgi:antitoxin MazE
MANCGNCPHGAATVESHAGDWRLVVGSRSGCILKLATMPNESTISKWGNSLAVRIPLTIAKQASLAEGDCVKMSLDRDGAIVLRPAARKYDLSDLVARITPKNRHRETDWGRPEGEESWCATPNDSGAAQPKQWGKCGRSSPPLLGY